MSVKAAIAINFHSWDGWLSDLLWPLRWTLLLFFKHAVKQDSWCQVTFLYVSDGDAYVTASLFDEP